MNNQELLKLLKNEITINEGETRIYVENDRIYYLSEFGATKNDTSFDFLVDDDEEITIFYGCRKIVTVKNILDYFLIKNVNQFGEAILWGDDK